MRKPKMTRQRKQIIEKLQNSNLMFGYTEQGAKEFWFKQGGAVNEKVITGMLARGLLKISEEGPFGVGQEIVVA